MGFKVGANLKKWYDTILSRYVSALWSTQHSIILSSALLFKSSADGLSIFFFWCRPAAKKAVERLKQEEGSAKSKI